MEFFATDEALADLERDLAIAQGVQRLLLQTTLAWGLRQRDSQRAMELVLDVEKSMTAPSTWAAALASDAPTLCWRLNLVRAEVLWLAGDFSSSLALAEAGLQGFRALGDRIGEGDAHWLLTCLALELGDSQRKNRELAAMLACVEQDAVRHCIGQATQARFAVFRGSQDSTKQWLDTLAALAEHMPIAARCAIEDVFGLAAEQRSDFAQAIQHFSHAYSMAMACGQIRRAIIATSNIGNAFNQLNDYHSALEWMGDGLTLARRVNWPMLVGAMLTRTADTLAYLHAYDAAHAMLQEVLALMVATRESRNYALALGYMGKVELAREQYANALHMFEMLEQRAHALKNPDLLADACIGQASALLALGQPEVARQAAQSALVSGRLDQQVAALRVLAALHGKFSLSVPPECVSKNVSLHYLLQARDLSLQIEGYIVPGDLLETISEQYAAQGDFHQAWSYAKQAASSREKTHSRETTQRAQAMQIAHQIERARVESAHQRELESKAKRAEILQQTSETLEHLGAIGQEITALLNIEQVFATLHRHIESLFDMTFFAVYLLDAARMQLDGVFIRDHGKPLNIASYSLNSSVSATAQCAREQRELLINYDPNSVFKPTWVPGAQHTRTALFAPLILAGKVLGLMTIQTSRPNAYAYGTREQLILRTLSAYTAIALSNAEAHGKLARAHQQLLDTQQQMLLQGKMAGLGTLTAGVAHEINNPTNFVHVATQNLRVDMQRFRQYLAQIVEEDGAPEVMQSFDLHFETMEKSLATVMNGTERIKNIVRDLRSFTRLDESESKTVHLSECMYSTLNLVRTSWQGKVDFITDFRDDPLIECWPALLNQVMMNLLVNACQAIEEKQQQQGFESKSPLHLRMFQEGGALLVEFEDSGVGINEAVKARIMDPFFTTKAVGIGTGLGPSIAFGIIEKHGGTLSFRSIIGEGSCFTICLPINPRSSPPLDQAMIAGARGD